MLNNILLTTLALDSFITINSKLSTLTSKIFLQGKNFISFGCTNIILSFMKIFLTYLQGWKEELLHPDRIECRSFEMDLSCSFEGTELSWVKQTIEQFFKCLISDILICRTILYHVHHLLQNCDVCVLQKVQWRLKFINLVENSLTFILATFLVNILSVGLDFGVNVGDIGEYISELSLK